MKTWVPAARIIAAAGVGLVMGVATWGEGRAPALGILLPLAIAVCASRLQAFVLSAGYIGATIRFNRDFMNTWFEGQLIPTLGWFGLVLFAALVWNISWNRSGTIARRAGFCLLGWLAAGFTPAAALMAGHPLVVAGYFLPGWGWLGVFAAAGFAPLALIGMSKLQLRPIGEIIAVASAGISLAAASPLLNVPVVDQVRGVASVQTQWGHLAGVDATLSRVAAMGQTQAAASPRVTTFVWSEAIIGRYEPALYPVLELELLKPSRRAGRVAVVGLDIPVGPNRLQTAAVAFYPDGSTSTAVARQPVPGALWRPWSSDGSFVADWGASNMLQMGQGDRAAVFFCYEEFLPALYLVNELRDAPTMYLVLSNTWADRDGGADRLQMLHSHGMALLFGRSYLRAANRPEQRQN